MLFINTSSNCFSSLVEFVALKTSERAKNKIYFFISKNYSLATGNFWEKQDYLLYTKQWPLAGEFVEFEYSPKIHHFWRIQVLAKMVIFENWPDSIHSPTFANLFWSDSIHSPDICQPLSPDSIHLRKANLHEFSELGKFSECRLDRFIHIKYVICA